MSNTHAANPAASGQTGVPAPIFTDIICAVDGTHTSNAAVRMAAHLAGAGGRLTLLAVTAEAGSGQYAVAAISPQRAEEILAYACELAEQDGVSATTVVDPERPPVEVIMEHASRHDLLVLGAPATSAITGLIVGGVAAEALSRFTTPMLVARRTFSGPLRGRPMIVASDGEAGSERVVELATRLALSQGSHLTLVHAAGSESHVAGRAIEEQGSALAEAMPGASDTRVLPGKAVDVILDTAAATDAAVAVLGSRRLGGVHAFGSVSRRVVHEAPCSVLLVPPPAAQ